MQLADELRRVFDSQENQAREEILSSVRAMLHTAAREGKRIVRYDASKKPSTSVTSAIDALKEDGLIVAEDRGSDQREGAWHYLDVSF